MDITAALQDRDQAELIAVVRRALGTERVEVIEWHAHPLSYDRTSPVSAGVYRVVGTASDGSRSVPWSLVLKVLRSPAGLTMPNGFVIPRDLPDDPGLFSYWKREALAYGENVLGCLPTGIVAPRCYGVTTAADGTV